MARKLTNRDLTNLHYVSAVLNHSTNQPMQPTLHAALCHCLGLVGEILNPDEPAAVTEPQDQDAPPEPAHEPAPAKAPTRTPAQRSAAATKAAATRKANKPTPSTTAAKHDAAGTATNNASSQSTQT